MGFIIGLLTFILVVDCVVLVFLVLLQLPKKEAGAGLAFGGAATDALFGAGSGNVLTQITKYAATVFFVLAVALSILQVHYQRRGVSQFEQRLQQAAPAAPSSGPLVPGKATPAPTAPAATPVVPQASTNVLRTAPTPAAEATNTPTAPTAPAAK